MKYSLINDEICLCKTTNDFMKLKILLVDNEPDAVEFLSCNFIRIGYEIEAVKNGIEKVMNAGMTGDDYISKPVSFSIIMEFVEKHISSMNKLTLR